MPKPPSNKKSATTNNSTAPVSGQKLERSVATGAEAFRDLVVFFFVAIFVLVYHAYVIRGDTFYTIIIAIFTTFVKALVLAHEKTRSERGSFLLICTV